MNSFPGIRGPVKRISVIGISGAGKSTFARQLGEKTGLPVYHMDSLFWGPGWTERPDALWRKEEKTILARPCWILEGYIDDNYPERLQCSDLVIYLDLSGPFCAWHGAKRSIFHAHKPRPELPEKCTDSFDLSYLWTMLMRKERPGIEAALEKVNSVRVVRLKTCRAVKNFLAGL